MLLQANNNNSTWAVNMAGVTDGTSNTVIFGEAHANRYAANSTTGYGVGATNTYPIWAGGNPSYAGQGRQHNYFRTMDVNFPLNSTNSSINERCFNSLHTGGANFAMVDGSVRFISNGVSPQAYQAAGTRNGGEAIPLN